MFQKQTLLILGAGASKPYGFPLGEELINEIIKHIRHDSVFFPYTNENKSKILNNLELNLNEYEILRKKIDTHIFLKALRKLQNSKSSSQSYDQIIASTNHMIDNRIYKFPETNDTNFIRIQLNQIKELKYLANALEDIDPTSIDSFLRDHPEHALAGRLMIFYHLIDLHDNKKFRKHIFLDSKSANINYQTSDNWYRHLLNDIKSGCRTPADILKNNLSIITFNYDVSLDYYLQEKLTHTSFFKSHTNEFLDNLKINHVYGSLCDPNNIEEFHNIRKNHSSLIERDIINLHHLLYGYLESTHENPRLKLIGERENIDTQQIIEKIKNAEKIIFLGFGFDANNLNLLGFNKPLAGYDSTFLLSKNMGGIPSTKKICYLDFEGKMQGLHYEFQELSNHINLLHHHKPLRIIRSTESSISKAYNDFKDRIIS